MFVPLCIPISNSSSGGALDIFFLKSFYYNGLKRYVIVVLIGISQLTVATHWKKNSDAGNDWEQEEKGATEKEMVG